MMIFKRNSFGHNFHDLLCGSFNKATIHADQQLGEKNTAIIVKYLHVPARYGEVSIGVFISECISDQDKKCY